jgi:hypothetical protein
VLHSSLLQIWSAVDEHLRDMALTYDRPCKLIYDRRQKIREMLFKKCCLQSKGRAYELTKADYGHEEDYEADHDDHAH